MIEKSLQDILQKIFDFKKTSFNAPSESHEQECLFIELDSINTNIEDNALKAKVTGKCSAYAPSEKLTAGYFSKMIMKAPKELTKDLFFYDLEGSALMELDIVKRGFSFIYFFVGQYDPHADNIASITIEGLE